MPGRDKGGQGRVYYTSTDSFTTLYSTKSSQSQFLFMPEFSSLSSLSLYSLEKSEKSNQTWLTGPRLIPSSSTLPTASPASWPREGRCAVI